MSYEGSQIYHDGVYIISHGDDVGAGSGSKSNQPHKELADRTAWLKNKIENDLIIETLGTSGAIGTIPSSNGDGTVSMVPASTVLAAISGLITTDHGEFDGLADDDHKQYILVDSTRAFTAPVSGETPTVAPHLTTKDYVDTEITNHIPDMIILADLKPPSLSGSASTSGSWETRDLQTEIMDTGNFCTLVAGTSTSFELEPGTYDVMVEAPAYKVDTHQARLKDITNTSYIYGTTSSASSLYDGMSNSLIVTRLDNLLVNTQYKIEHRTQTPNATNGFGGQASDFGSDNLYLIVRLKKIK